MFPIIFHWGSFTIYAYGLFLALGFLCATLLAAKRAPRLGVSKEKIYDLTFILLIFGIIGARLAYVLVNFEYYRGNWREIFMLHRGGLVFYGGFLLALIAGLIFLKRNKLNIWLFCDEIIPFVALGHAIGRIGCFLNGCCFGKETISILGIQFPSLNYKVYPTQLFEAAVLGLIFLLLITRQKRPHFRGEIFLAYLFLYAGARYFLEYLRGDVLPVFLGLTFAQLVSLIFIAAVPIFWLILRKGPK